MDGCRGIRTDNGADELGPIVVKHSAQTFDGASGPFYNENFSSAFRIEEVDDIEVGIEEVKGQNGVKAVYDLQGRKVANPTKGIYIINGKKVLIK